MLSIVILALQFLIRDRFFVNQCCVTVTLNFQFSNVQIFESSDFQILEFIVARPRIFKHLQGIEKSQNI